MLTDNIGSSLTGTFLPGASFSSYHSVKTIYGVHANYERASASRPGTAEVPGTNGRPLYGHRPLTASSEAKFGFEESARKREWFAQRDKTNREMLRQYREEQAASLTAFRTAKADAEEAERARLKRDVVTENYEQRLAEVRFHRVHAPSPNAIPKTIRFGEKANASSGYISGLEPWRQRGQWGNKKKKAFTPALEKQVPDTLAAQLLCGHLLDSDTMYGLRYYVADAEEMDHRASDAVGRREARWPRSQYSCYLDEVRWLQGRLPKQEKKASVPADIEASLRAGHVLSGSHLDQLRQLHQKNEKQQAKLRKQQELEALMKGHTSSLQRVDHAEPTKVMRAALEKAGEALPTTEEELLSLSVLFNEKLEDMRVREGKPRSFTYFNLFSELDTDRSGAITYDELRVVVRKRLLLKSVVLSESRLQALWCVLDADDSDSIRPNEISGFFKKGTSRKLAIEANQNRPKKTMVLAEYELAELDMKRIDATIPTRTMRMELEKEGEAIPDEAELTQMSALFNERLEAYRKRSSLPPSFTYYNLFKAVDMDDSGYVSYDELVRVVRKRLELKQADLADGRLKALWCVLDADDSNKIRPNEAAAFFKGKASLVLKDYALAADKREERAASVAR